MITLQNYQNVRISFYNELYDLTNSTHSTENSHIVVIYLSTFDSNSIKALAGLAISINTTYISTGVNLVKDMSGVVASQIPDYLSLWAAVFIPDTTKPRISHAILNLTSETITIYVSETIRVNTVNLIHFSLHSLSNRQLYLSGGTVSSVNSPIFSFTLRTNDIYLLQQDQDFATNLTNVYFSFSEYFLSDMNDNPIVPVNSSNRMRFSAFISDTVPPTLISFSLNLNNGELFLNFSETVRGSTIQLCDIVLKNLNHRFAISNFSVITILNSPIIVIKLSTVDLNSIKSSLTDATSFFIFMIQCPVRDMAQNLFIPLEEENALISTSIFTDITSPQLLSFILNLNSSQVCFLSCTFSRLAAGHDSVNVTNYIELKIADNMLKRFN